MYYGGGNASVNNPQNTPLTMPFVTTYLRGRTDGFMLKGGDATKGSLTTMYDGPRPFVDANGNNTQGRNYQPAKKQGAIILATGGDNSNSAMGCFYEGYMVSGVYVYTARLPPPTPTPKLTRPPPCPVVISHAPLRTPEQPTQPTRPCRLTSSPLPTEREGYGFRRPRSTRRRESQWKGFATFGAVDGASVIAGDPLWGGFVREGDTLGHCGRKVGSDFCRG